MGLWMPQFADHETEIHAQNFHRQFKGYSTESIVCRVDGLVCVIGPFDG